MSRRSPHRRPPAIQVGPPRQTDLTFENTSLEPFLRQYTRMSSRESGGGDKQAAEEINFARRLVVEMEKWWSASPEAISDLVTNITDPKPAHGRAYPTVRSHGVSDELARENRIIIAMILMHHAKSDTGHGRDGGMTSGGLWLPPRAPAIEEQNRAQAEGRLPIYPTWSREEAVAMTPRISENWTVSNQPPPFNDRSRGLPGSPAGRVPPFIPAKDRSPLSGGFPSSSYAGFNGYGVPPSSPGWTNYNTFQPLQRGQMLPNGGIYPPTYGALQQDRSERGNPAQLLGPGGLGNLRLADPTMGQSRPRPGHEVEQSAPLGRATNIVAGLLHAPIGTSRPQPGSTSGGVGSAPETPHRDRNSSSTTARRKTPGSRSSHRESSRPPNPGDTSRR